MRVSVEDPFGVVGDPAMPRLDRALDPAVMEQELRRLPRQVAAGELLALRAIRVVRYKPSRRCLIEYDIENGGAGKHGVTVTWIGKVRAGRPNRSGYRLLEKLRRAGFAEPSPDGILVPEPIGLLPEIPMWLQRKVPGSTATDLLAGSDGDVLAPRIAEAADKIHRAGVPPKRRHAMADELRILEDRLSRVAAAQPGMKNRLHRLLRACERRAADTPDPAAPTGIHRDYYADQIVIDGERLYVVDFDLYCAGDPALDIGNFLGHVTEQALRTTGDPAALASFEAALEDRFVELAGAGARMAVRAYADLTLVRHVYLSTLFPERRWLTRRLMAICEERLGIRRAARAKEVG
jgi:aminoglycoside phosphotransferase (APT) family kinase protein